MKYRPLRKPLRQGVGELRQIGWARERYRGRLYGVDKAAVSALANAGLDVEERLPKRFETFIVWWPATEAGRRSG